MDNKTIEIIREIASKLRWGFEEQCGDRWLGGMCWDVSDALQKKLYEHKIFPDLITGEFRTNEHGYFHYWLELDGYIIDLTATQFNKDYHPYGEKYYPEILIEPIKKMKEYRERMVA